jgi:N6-adenosine-specific RNA methylase IME4
MFSRGKRPGWTVWGNQADESYKPDWPTYNYNSGLAIAAE